MSDTSLTIENILAPELTLCRVAASSKKRALEFIAEQINHCLLYTSDAADE